MLVVVIVGCGKNMKMYYAQNTKLWCIVQNHTRPIHTKMKTFTNYIILSTFPEPTALLVAASEGGLVMAGAMVVVVVVAGGKLLPTDETTGGTPEG